VVLLPVKWETHALPTSGVRPQSAINDQLVDRCDILIGMLWTKLGISTGVAASGTVEEIDRFVAAGKPAMLYFSTRKASKDKADPKQAARLRKFKSATYKKSLVGSFASVPGLRQVLLRDLTRQVRLLQPGKSAHAVFSLKGKGRCPRKRKRAEPRCAAAAPRPSCACYPRCSPQGQGHGRPLLRGHPAPRVRVRTGFP
jgi:hypothetical protein